MNQFPISGPAVHEAVSRPPTLWLLLPAICRTGQPGVRKSSTVNFLVRPFIPSVVASALPDNLLATRKLSQRVAGLDRGSGCTWDGNCLCVLLSRLKLFRVETFFRRKTSSRLNHWYIHRAQNLFRLTESSFILLNNFILLS